MIISGHTCGRFLLRAFLPKLRKRLFESGAGDHKVSQILTQTTILVQDGLEIEEVPLIVRKTTDIGALCSNTPNQNSPRLPSKDPTSKSQNAVGKSKDQNEVPSIRKADVQKIGKQRLNVETEEGTAILFCPDLDYFKNTDLVDILNAFDPARSATGLYTLLEDKINAEINCRVALDGLKKMIEMENSQRHRYRYTRHQSSEQQSMEALNRDTVMKQLVKMIAKSHDSDMVIHGLMTLRRDKVSAPRNVYRDWLCEEALIRATDGELTPSQLISVVKILASYKHAKYKDSIDNLWVGIEIRELDITPELLVPLFKLMRYFNQSKNMVRIILERKLSEHWLSLTGSQLAQILNCFYGNTFSVNCLMNASKWAAVSMNTSEEADLVKFLRSLDAKEYIDKRVESALEEYIKVKGSQIKDPALVAAIMNYCENLQVRNVHILTGCARYFMKYGLEIPSSFLTHVLTPFGLLNVQPPEPEKFWKVFEQVLLKRFTELKLADVLDILLSCTYLEKYPLLFADKLFDLYFHDKRQTRKDSNSPKPIQNKLKLFDAAMSLECKEYRGSRLPIDRTAKSLCLDVRIRRIVNLIYKPLATLVGGERKLSKSVVLNRLPLINFYVLDMLIHPTSVATHVFNLNLQQKKNINTVVLIYLPEYYCRNTHQLIGPQVMRRRHLRKLGFRVMTLEYSKLEELLNGTDKLSNYLSKSLELAEDAI